jgi:hypothetical protein
MAPACEQGSGVQVVRGTESGPRVYLTFQKPVPTAEDNAILKAMVF